MPSDTLKNIVKVEEHKFFITRIEEMYQLVRHNVPASRSTIHSILYLTEGEAVMKIGSEVYKIKKDEMLFVPAGQVFSFQTGDINKGYICGLHNDLLIGKFGKTDPLKEFEFLRVWGNPRITLNAETSEFIHHILKRLLVEYIQNGLKNQDIFQSYLLALFCEVKNVYQPLTISGKASSISITNKFKELVFSNIKDKHLVSDYASLLNISPNHLNKTVKAVTAKSPTKWIDEAIVSEAKVLLCQSELSISEVAMEVGFEDQSYFTRLFKKYEKMTPTDFRKMIEMS
ncbi:helix-turn-helix domain-containing protein [Dyadobacter subterraneus]